MKADEEDDAPTVAAVIDERPEELRTVLFFVRGNLKTSQALIVRGVLIGLGVKYKPKKAETRWLESNRKRQITKTQIKKI